LLLKEGASSETPFQSVARKGSHERNNSEVLGGTNRPVLFRPQRSPKEIDAEAAVKRGPEIYIKPSQLRSKKNTLAFRREMESDLRRQADRRQVKTIKDTLGRQNLGSKGRAEKRVNYPLAGERSIMERRRRRAWGQQVPRFKSGS